MQRHMPPLAGHRSTLQRDLKDTGVMEVVRQAGGPLVPMAAASPHMQSSSASSGCNPCGLCGALTQDMGCAACNAIKCPVCTVWVVADEADAHIDECFEDEEALRRVQMETKAKESRQNKPAAPSSSGKSPKSKRKVESIGDDDDVDEDQPFELDSSDLASNDGDDDFLRDVVIAAKSSEQAQRKKKAASRPVLDGVRLCNGLFEGCGERCDLSATACPRCRRLLVAPPNCRGEQFHHGQVVWFGEKNQGFLREGHIVEIHRDGTVRVRYKEKQFAVPNHDEHHSIDKISTDPSLVDGGRHSRNRRPPPSTDMYIPVEVPRKKRKPTPPPEAMGVPASSSSSTSISSSKRPLVVTAAARAPTLSPTPAEPKPTPFRPPLVARKAGAPPVSSRTRKGNSSDSDDSDDSNDDDDDDDDNAAHSDDDSLSIFSSSSQSSEQSSSGSKSIDRPGAKGRKPAARAAAAADEKKASLVPAPRPQSHIPLDLPMHRYPEGVNFEQALANIPGISRLGGLAQLRLFKLLVAWCFGKNAVDNTQSPDGDALEPHAVRTILEDPAVRVGNGLATFTLTLRDLVYISAFCPTHPSQFDAIARMLTTGVETYTSQLSTLNSWFLWKHKTERQDFDEMIDSHSSIVTIYRRPDKWPDIESFRESFPIARDAPLNLYQFRVLLEMAFRQGFGSRKQLEEDSKIKGNRKQAGGKNAMYGSIQPLLVDVIISKCNLQPDHRFIDIGSGIGQVVLQVAACVGAQSVGIEIDAERHDAGVRLQGIFEELHQQFGGADMSGKARLICGDFVDYRDEVLQANVMFLNNFGGWWSAEKSEPNTLSLENQLIELLKACREGTQLVTLSPLHEVCGWMDEEEFVSPDHATSWIQDPIRLYRYTKKDCWRCTKCDIDNYVFSDQCQTCGCRRSRRQRSSRS